MNPLAKRVVIHLGVYLILFFLVPYFQSSTSENMNNVGNWMLLLLLINPLAVLLLNGESGLRRGFDLALCLLPGLLFTLSVYLFMDGNSSALFYSAVYALTGLAGGTIGARMRVKRV